MKRSIRLSLLPGLLLLVACSREDNMASPKATLRVEFENRVGNEVLQSNANYVNPHGEDYTISQFNYYVSFLRVGKTSGPYVADPETYHLVTSGQPSSRVLSMELPAGRYRSLEYLLGVDSTRNVSGAQTGALDPLNGMFWTWNSGYIYAKLEGTSSKSQEPGQLYQYHIGGFRTPYNTTRVIQLAFPGSGSIDVGEGQVLVISVHADAQAWFEGGADIRIADQPNITSPGADAMKMADNYKNMFRITNVRVE